MKDLKQLWQKRWFRNLLFLGFISIAFFTSFPLWVNIQVTKWNLTGTENATIQKSAESVYEHDMILESASGENLKLSAFKGKPVLLNFWASWCVPCLAEFESLDQLQEEMPDLQFVFISTEQEVAFKKYVNETSWDFDFYMQKSSQPQELNHRAIPTTYILNENGFVVMKKLGAANWSNSQTIAQITTSLKK